MATLPLLPVKPVHPVSVPLLDFFPMFFFPGSSSSFLVLCQLDLVPMGMVVEKGIVLCELGELTEEGSYQTVGYGVLCVDLVDVAPREVGSLCPLHDVHAMSAVVVSPLRTIPG